MVRLRLQNGTTQPVQKLEAIEILDSEGRLAMVVFANRRDTIQALMPGDPVFTAYCRAHSMGAARVHRHEAPAVRHDLD